MRHIHESNDRGHEYNHGHDTPDKRGLVPLKKSRKVRQSINVELGVHCGELSVGKRVLAGRVRWVEAVLLETFRTNIGTADIIAGLEARAVDRGAL